jgi:hypothetical protein
MDALLSLTNILWVVGIFMVAVAAIRVRAPYGRMQELDRLADNARRYEGWRGGRKTAAGGGETGADVMRALLRRQVVTWLAVGGVGAVLILLGFLVR